jgi:hypothetical protein
VSWLRPHAPARSAALVQVGFCVAREGKGAFRFIVAIDQRGADFQPESGNGRRRELRPKVSYRFKRSAAPFGRRQAAHPEPDSLLYTARPSSADIRSISSRRSWSNALISAAVPICYSVGGARVRARFVLSPFELVRDRDQAKSPPASIPKIDRTPTLPASERSIFSIHKAFCLRHTHRQPRSHHI